MARIISDRVQETSTTTGSGAYTLSGAVLGFRELSTVCVDGDTFTYSAEDVDSFGRSLGGWETGLGTWGTGGILTRTTIYASSNANAAVVWAAGTRRITLSLTANASLGPLTVTGNTTLDGFVAVGDATISSNVGINSSFTLSANAQRSGIQNFLFVDNTTALTADRNHMAAYNLTEVQLDNSNAFSVLGYGAYNIARTQYGGGNIDGEGGLYGSINYASHNTYNKTRPRVENAYGAQCLVYASSTTLTLSVTTVNTSTTATTTDTSNISVGAVITGHAGIPASTTVASITDATTFVMSAAATNSSTDTSTVFTQSTSQIDNAYGVYSIVRPIYAGATITNGYMYYGTTSTVTGTYTNRWGVYIASTVNNYFAGGLQIGGTATGSTSAAGLGVGTAPSGVAGEANILGRVRLSHTASLGNLNSIVGLSAAGTSIANHDAAFVRYNTDSIGPTIHLASSKVATVGTHALVANGDVLGTIDFRGSDAANFIQGAEIFAQVDGTPGTNDMPTRIAFATTNDGASVTTNKAYINSKGELGLVSPASNGGQIRLKSADTTTGYGIIHRYDGTSYYLLSTAVNDADGAWNANRPFTYAPSTNAVTAGGTWNFSSATTGTSFNSITALSSTTPTALGVAAVGTSTTVARADHIHPIDVTLMADYTALRAYTGSATGVTITSTGVAGQFFRSATDTTSADNGGTIIVDASSRRWIRIFSGSVNVKWFGAIGNDSANDTAAIQAAITAASASVFFPTGVYIVSTTTLTVANGIRLYGEGKFMSVIKWTSTTFTPITVTSTSSVCFERLYIAGPDSATSGAAINITSVNNFSIFRDVLFANGFNSIVTSQSMTFTIDNCYFSGFKGAGVIVRNTNEPDAGDSIISNCMFSNFGANAYGIIQYSSGGLRVINNKFTGVPGSPNNGLAGFVLQLDVGANTSDLLLTGNSFENFATSAIIIQGNPTSGTFSNIVITGNQFALSPQVILMNTITRATFARLTFTGNLISCTSTTLDCLQLAWLDLFQIANNTFEGGGGTSRGISVDGNCTRGRIRLNQIINFGTAVSNSAGANVVVADN